MIGVDVIGVDVNSVDMISDDVISSTSIFNHQNEYLNDNLRDSVQDTRSHIV